MRKMIETKEIARWSNALAIEINMILLARLHMLKVKGPHLGRPYVDTVKGSKFINMKELRFCSGRDHYRILFIFDPKHRAVLLIGGIKYDNNRFYKDIIKRVDRIYEGYLKRIGEYYGK